eukprot:CAMPEP_0119312710 /NCGR_PEP_ID=MMETSP1333-20130426/26966_1 /TAXON_ID=418940 /ORGANISM="Scyphosphaera apsteinii, Strain RCC1455" /LENGTH=206 /DNA_ID=CAMNT_0007317367 /DNA_START=29 /DNA_END=646 /DNA_ORIENTATION=+
MSRTRGSGGSSSGDGLRFLAAGRSCDRVIIASYAHHSDSAAAQRYHAVTQRVLGSANTIERYPRLTVTDRESGTVHYDTDQTCIFLIVTSPEYPQRIAFKCLGELKTRFNEAHGEAVHKSAEGGLTRAGRMLFVEVASRFEEPASVDKATHLLREVGEVKDIMQDSIQDLLATRENLEVLEDKTIQLRSEAATFQRKAVDLRRSMW